MNKILLLLSIVTDLSLAVSYDSSYLIPSDISTQYSKYKLVDNFPMTINNVPIQTATIYFIPDVIDVQPNKQTPSSPKNTFIKLQSLCFINDGSKYSFFNSFDNNVNNLFWDNPYSWLTSVPGYGFFVPSLLLSYNIQPYTNNNLNGYSILLSGYFYSPNTIYSIGYGYTANIINFKKQINQFNLNCLVISSFYSGMVNFDYQQSQLSKDINTSLNAYLTSIS